MTATTNRAPKDTAHEMKRFLNLHVELNSPRLEYPDVVWQAMRTAYAAHVRNLLKFFRERAPALHGLKADIRYSDFVSPNPFRIRSEEYPPDEADLWRRASKQVSHLSGYRDGSHGEWEDAPEWGAALTPT